MALRDKWEFAYRASDVAKAAADKRDFHASRLRFWRDKQTETMAAIRSEGLEIDESVAGGGYTTTGRNPQVMVKTEFQRDLNECSEKIAEHSARVREYTSFADGLGANGDQVIALTVNDIEFFYGK